MTNKKILTLLVSSAILAGCGGGGGSSAPASNTGNAGSNTGNSDYLPYTAEHITQKTFASLSGIQHITQPDDSKCTFAALSGKCEAYSYNSVAYSIPEESSSTSLDDIATTVFAVDSYIATQSELWGFASTEELLSTVALKRSPLTGEAAELIAYDLERQANTQPTQIDANILTAAAAHKSASDTCTDLGYGALTENHCAAERYIRDIKTKSDWQLISNRVLRTSASQYTSNANYFDTLCTYVSSSQVMCTLAKDLNTVSFARIDALFGTNKTAQIKVVGFAYQGDTNKGGYISGDMQLPNNLSAYPDFDAKVINHELTHLFVDAMADNGLLGTELYLNFMVEGIPTLFAKQQVWTWSKMAELAQGGSDYLLKMDNYNTRAALVNYLLVATTSAEAKNKHDVMVNFIKTLSNKGDVVKAFNEAGFTNHKGQAVTLDTLKSSIATWVTELANDPAVGSYKSRAYDNFK